MISLQYKFHILLNIKYNLVLNILIYILIFNIYYITFNDVTIIECMRGNPIDLTSPENTDSDYVNYLEDEAWRMDRRIAELERELENYRYKDQVVERITQIEKNIEYLQTENRVLHHRINALEKNERSLAYYLSFCNIL